MAKKDYEQTEMDLRSEMTRQIFEATTETVDDALDAIKATNPATIRNRHEAYGIAADNYTKVSGCVKAVKGDMEQLLRTLADPNFPAVEAVSALHNSTSKLAATVITMAAEMKRTTNDLYLAESRGDVRTPMEEMLDGPDFQEAEPADAIEDDE